MLWISDLTQNFALSWYSGQALSLSMSLSQISCFKILGHGTSLVAQWLRIRLPMQGTRVRALVQEDPTCRGASKPVHHNYWACAVEPASHNYWAHVPQLLSPCATTTEPTCHDYWSPHAWSPCSATREATAMKIPRTATKSSPHSRQLEKACMQQRRPNTAKNKNK